MSSLSDGKASFSQANLDDKLKAEDDRRKEEQRKKEDEKHQNKDKENHVITGYNLVKHHSCTDLICLVLFVIVVVTWVSVIIAAFSFGNPDEVLAPTDSLGLQCGRDEEVKDKPYLFFFDILKCVSRFENKFRCKTHQVCVKKCPDEMFISTLYILNKTNPKDLNNRLICMYEHPNNESLFDLIVGGYCAEWYLSSEPMGGNCIPSPDKKDVETILYFLAGDLTDQDGYMATNYTFELAFGMFKEATERANKIIHDIRNSLGVIVLFLFISSVLSVAYIYALQVFIDIVVWFSLGAFFLALGSCTAYIGYKYATTTLTEDKNSQRDEFIRHTKYRYLILLIIFSIFFFINAVFVFIVRKSIVVAIDLIREASKAFSPTTIVFPVLTALLHIAVLTLGLSVMLYLATSGEKQYEIELTDPNYTHYERSCNYNVGDNCNLKEFVKYDKDKCPGKECVYQRYVMVHYTVFMQVFNVFAIFYFYAVTTAFCRMSLAECYVSWYWYLEKSEVPSMIGIPTVVRTLRYHIGTLAFGAFLTTFIIWIFKIFLGPFAWIYRKLYVLVYYKNVKTTLAKVFCLIYFYERNVRYVNRSVYVMCAIKGTNFCQSAWHLSGAIASGSTHQGVIMVVTRKVAFYGKFIVVLATYFLWNMLAHEIMVEHLHYDSIPITILIPVCYWTVDVFVSLFEMAVLTIFICFVEDCDVNDGSDEKPYFMSKNLKRIMGNVQTDNE